MGVDQGLLERLRRQLANEPAIEERKMFGGVCFLFDRHMLCGVNRDVLVVRVGPEAYEEALERPYARECDLTGRPLRGIVMIDPPGFEEDADLASWLLVGLGFTRSLPPKT